MAILLVVIFLAVNIPRASSRDTDGCVDSSVSRRVSRPKTRFSSRDTDRIGKSSVSWQRKEKEDRNRDLGSEEMRQ